MSGTQRLLAEAAVHYDVTHIDSVDPAVLNRDTWYATRGWTVPYPGDVRVLRPDEVPCTGDDNDAGR